MATTPPLRTGAQTPPTPLHGARYDQYRHSTRKSTRPTRSRALETPPPNSEQPLHNPASSNSRKLPKIRSAAHTYSPPSSTQTSPRKASGKKRMSDPTIDANGVNGRSSSTEAPTLDPMQSHDLKPSSNKQAMKTATTMLPTPAKTPRKKQVQSAAVNGAARVLFPVHPVEDAMPTPRKRRNKRTVGFSLYNDEDDEEEKSEDRIQIYTDSKDKFPELDPSEDNPFYEKPKDQTPPPAPSQRRSSRKRKAASSVEEKKVIKEAFNREEGMVYVFRGKKIFRKFPEDGDEPDDGEDSELESTNVRPLTRSSIKPRLLFPTQKQNQEREAANTEDEEATTDIEDHNDTPMSDPEEEQHVTTPRKQTVFSPATPPTTGHATRQATKRTPEELVEPVPYKGKKVSPFDGWARTKAGSANGTAGGGKGRKREAEAMEKADGARGNKKMRGAGTT